MSDQVDEDFDFYWDDDLGSAKEEPDCFSCNDSGCRACARHPENCDCEQCFEAIVAEHEYESDVDAGLISATFADTPPF
ncbi:hypothetical protein BBK82_03585 [Lentzea guizhouensis]|uniref:Uncharacterized protein n=1 Tax=Lentzea guizhouensis TaxID=1586287 RepID=A0A1B2HC47_9PSEU|nr:hypothetical protein [Lentzea guizhouensis]ANZ35298.1 hypothetical protein BBK82_03585 [Lentzea guizhouensis]